VAATGRRRTPQGRIARVRVPTPPARSTHVALGRPAGPRNGVTAGSARCP